MGEKLKIFSFFDLCLLLNETDQEPDEAPGSKEQLRLSAGRMGGLLEGGRFAERGAEQQLWSCARENREPAR